MSAFPRLAIFLVLLLAAAPARATLAEVRIEGVEGAIEENIRAYLSVTGVLDDDTVPDSQIAYLHGQAVEEIEAALKPFGYYRPEIQATIQKLDSGWIVRYVIDPGPPVKITELNIGLTGAGSNDETLTEAVGAFPLAEGEIFLHQVYESGKGEIRTLLDARGYFAAELAEHQVTINPAALSAVINLRWETGPRYRFGAVQFEGGQFSEEFLRRFVPFESGEFYTQQALLELQRELYNTAYFEHVGVDARREQANNAVVPVVVSLVPNEPNRYTLGLSYGTDTGARIEAGYERRWLNDQGHSFRVSAGLGTRHSDLNLQYAIPVHERDVREYVFGAALVDETTESVERQTAKLSVNRVGSWGPWDQIISLNALYEEFQFDGTGTQSATVLYPELRLSRIEANDALIPTRGWSLTMYGRAGAKAVVSDTDFAQIGAAGRLILPAWGHDRWLFRADAATTWAGEFLRLPASLRYFAGGARSIRGFAYEALGPTNAQGEVIGGEHLLVASAEYEHMFTENWGMAVFVDAGDAFSDIDFEPEYGAGVGVRWRSPIGTVRLDVASALSRDNELMLHLVIGPFL